LACKLIYAVIAVDGDLGKQLVDGLEFDYAKPGEKPDARWREKAEVATEPASGCDDRSL
jgi:hypothetical protein